MRFEFDPSCQDCDLRKCNQLSAVTIDVKEGDADAHGLIVNPGTLICAGRHAVTGACGAEFVAPSVDIPSDIDHQPPFDDEGLHLVWQLDQAAEGFERFIRREAPRTIGLKH